MSVRHGESEQADGLISIVHLLDEALGLGQNGLHRYEHVGACGAAGDLAEVVELDFQCEGVAAKLLFLESADKFFRHMVELYDHGCLGADVLLKRELASYRLAHISRFNRAQVHSSREVVVHLAHLAERLAQPLERPLAQRISVVYAQRAHLFGSHPSHSPETFYRQRRYEVKSLVGVDSAESVGLAVVGCYLGEELIVRHPCRCRQIEPFPYLLLYLTGYVYCQFHARLVDGDVEESLVA